MTPNQVALLCIEKMDLLDADIRHSDCRPKGYDVSTGLIRTKEGPNCVIFFGLKWSQLDFVPDQRPDVIMKWRQKESGRTTYMLKIFLHTASGFVSLGILSTGKPGSPEMPKKFTMDLIVIVKVTTPNGTSLMLILIGSESEGMLSSLCSSSPPHLHLWRPAPIS